MSPKQQGEHLKKHKQSDFLIYSMFSYDPAPLSLCLNFALSVSYILVLGHIYLKYIFSQCLTISTLLCLLYCLVLFDLRTDVQSATPCNELTVATFFSINERSGRIGLKLSVHATAFIRHTVSQQPQELLFSSILRQFPPSPTTDYKQVFIQ